MVVRGPATGLRCRRLGVFRLRSKLRRCRWLVPRAGQRAGGSPLETQMHNKPLIRIGPCVRYYAVHGSIIATDRSPKCFAFRVAIAARRADAMPAIRVSRTSIARPFRSRSAASAAAASAAARSNAQPFPPGPAQEAHKAFSNFVRRRPCGIESKPKRISRTVTAVVQIDTDDCRSSHATTERLSCARAALQLNHTLVRLRIRNVSLEYSATCHHRYWSPRKAIIDS
jgi:hypothetical protein